VSRGWLIARIRGVEVRADASLLVLAILITYNLSVFYSREAILPVLWFQIRSTSPPLGQGPALALAVLTTVLFVGSILAHELAHAIAFRARGIPVRGITLFMFGGYTLGETEANKPADELLIAGVGPATTAVLGFGFLALHVMARGAGLHAFRAMFGYLAALNLFMGVFNLLPGLPLDGGRVFMSIVWRITGHRSRATRVAARTGQAVALAISAAGVIELVNSGDLGGLWLVLIGWMLLNGSTAALFQSDRARMLEAATAADVMSPPPPTVPADLPLSVAMERFLAGREGEAFPVIDDGRVVGFISPRLARDTRVGGYVRDAMTGTEAVAIANPTEPMTSVADRIRDQHAHVALVMEDDRLVGVIEQEDLARFFRRGRPSRSGRSGRVRLGSRSAPPGSPPPRPDAPEGGRP
jgi:Zn-dependent protease/predicted transcriptional regulator